jgi:hypothetical protein
MLLVSGPPIDFGELDRIVAIVRRCSVFFSASRLTYSRGDPTTTSDSSQGAFAKPGVFASGAQAREISSGVRLIPHGPGAMSRATRSPLFTALAFLALVGCGGGSGSSPPVANPGGSPASNSPPQISGAPATVVTVDKVYEFAPQASDSDGDSLEFSVSNPPSWAQFNTTTGRLSGIPALGDIGDYSSIMISVSDGKLDAALPAFAISVENEAAGSATLNWKAPTRNVDGSKLEDLAGFRIYYSQDPSNLVSHVEIPEPHTQRATIEGLVHGTWYFAVTAYTTAEIESSTSEIGSKKIG